MPAAEPQVALNAVSMTMCGLMLESILESASDFVSVSEEARFMQRCYVFAVRHEPLLLLTNRILVALKSTVGCVC